MDMCYFVDNLRYVYAIANRRIYDYVDDKENMKQEAVAQTWVLFQRLQDRMGDKYPVKTILRWATVDAVRDVMRGKRIAGRPSPGYRDAMSFRSACDYLVLAREDESRIDIDELIAMLPEETQEVARLLSFGYGKEDIAVRLDIGRGTVFNRCKLIRRALSRLIASQAA